MSGKPARVVFGHEIHGFAIRDHETIMAFANRNERELFEAWWKAEGQKAFNDSFVADGVDVACTVCGRIDLPAYQCWRVGHLVRYPNVQTMDQACAEWDRLAQADDLGGKTEQLLFEAFPELPALRKKSS